MSCIWRCGERTAWYALACAVATIAGSTAAPAGDWGEAKVTWGEDAVPAAIPSKFEVWSGGQAYSSGWSLYSGVTVAPFLGIQQDGVRVRASGGYGAYKYSGPRAAGVGSHIVEFAGAAAFGDLLVGYHKQLGSVTLKAFAGLTTGTYQTTPDDPETAIRGYNAGGKVALETWWTITDRAWLSVDASWASLFGTYGAQGRLGWRLWPALSAGLEVGAAGNQETDIARAGGFVRYEWASGEVSLSGGLSSSLSREGVDGKRLADESVPFATISYLSRF
jgi:hypothetical protein